MPVAAGKPAVMTQRGKGRRYEPGPDDARKVYEMIGRAGLRLEDVAAVMGIGLTTLKERFQQAIKAARAECTTQVADSLFQTAVDREHPKHVQAAKFWLQTQAKWSTTVRVEVGGAVDGDHDEGLIADLRSLSLERLRQLEAIADDLYGQSVVGSERGRSGLPQETQGGSFGDPSSN